MAMYRLRLELQAPLASPMASGMLFGQLCWALRDLEGNAALSAWLAEPQRLWALSDAFPADCLARPLLTPRLAPLRRLAPGEHKALRKRPLISREAFLRLRAGLSDGVLGRDELRPALDESRRTARNQIDRRTGRAADEGGLFFRAEAWPTEATRERDVYVEAPADDGPRVRRLFEHLGAEGFGKAAGLGRGRFAVTGMSEDRELFECPGANRYLSLSRGVASANMKDLLCRIEPHFGKVGQRIAVGEGASPFKRPMLLTRAGATFARDGEGRFGAWLTGVHPTRPEIGHNAWHLALPFVEAFDD